jgi:hypothetical protein
MGGVAGLRLLAVCGASIAAGAENVQLPSCCSNPEIGFPVVSRVNMAVHLS